MTQHFVNSYRVDDEFIGTQRIKTDDLHVVYARMCELHGPAVQLLGHAFWDATNRRIDLEWTTGQLTHRVDPPFVGSKKPTTVERLGNAFVHIVDKQDRDALEVACGLPIGLYGSYFAIIDDGEYSLVYGTSLQFPNLGSRAVPVYPMRVPPPIGSQIRFDELPGEIVEASGKDSRRSIEAQANIPRAAWRWYAAMWWYDESTLLEVYGCQDKVVFAETLVTRIY